MPSIKEATSSKADTNTLGVLFVQACHMHHHRAQALFDSIGIYRGQPPVIDALWEHNGMTQTELATRMNVRAATITRMVQRMARAGFIERRPDPDDQRVSRVYLTEAGREVRAAIRRVIRQINAEAFDGLSDAELSTLQPLLEHVRNNLAHANNPPKDS